MAPGGKDMIRIRKILYPTDFSSYSNQAYFHAVALAENHGATLTVLLVYSPDLPTPRSVPRSETRNYWQRQLEQIRPIDQAIHVEHVLLEGDPSREIVRYSRDFGIDLIVMGTHGRTGLERMLMGSVAEKVLRGASCSVLVVKLPGERQTVTPDLEVAVSPA
jgi:nucleotide-binding universal stress UspA family protein